jgi:hypothetical protein
MTIIPPTNLLVYFQKYTVAITDGEVSWALLSANPSNLPFNRVWSFELNGTLSHTTRETYVIEYNLDNVDTGGYVISFEGQGSLILSNSLFVINGKDLTFSYVETSTQKRIVLHLDANICPVKEGRTREFLLNFYLNDAATPCPPSFTIDFNQESSLQDIYSYTPPSSSSTEGVLQYTGSCSSICTVTSLKSKSTDFISATTTTSPSFGITTALSNYTIGIQSPLPAYFFQSIYGCSCQIGSSKYLSSIPYYTKGLVVFISSIITSNFIVLSYSDFTTQNSNSNSILPVGIATYSGASELQAVQFQVKIMDLTDTLSFFTALIDPSFKHSVMVLVPFPTSITTLTSYTADIQTSKVSSGWFWTAPSVSTTGFYALIQDTVSSKFITACSSSELCLSSSLDNTSLWIFNEITEGFTIGSYASSSPTYVTSSSQCSSAPCLLNTPCPWTITMPSSPVTDTDPFKTTINSKCSRKTEYMVATSGGTIKMSLTDTSYSWNIIPVVIAYLDT